MRLYRCTRRCVHIYIYIYTHVYTCTQHIQTIGDMTTSAVCNGILNRFAEQITAWRYRMPEGPGSGLHFPYEPTNKACMTNSMDFTQV